MADDLSKIKQIEGLLSLGLTLSEAVSQALGYSLSEFARRNGFRHTEISMCLLGYHQRVYPEIRDAICRELCATREWLDALIDSKPARSKGVA